MSDPVVELRSLIQEEEQRVRGSFTGPRQRAVLELTRSIDVDFTFASAIAASAAPASLASEHIDVREYGSNKALGLFTDDWCSTPYALLYPSEREAEKWADSAIQHCGRLGYCEMGLDMVRYGLADLRKLEPSSYEFVMRKGAGVEAVERQEIDFIRHVVQEMDKDAWKAINLARPDVMEQMSELVYVWRGHFPGHDTTPDIDNFYEKFGVFWGRQGYGQDSFPGDATFGGRPFGFYRAVVTMLIGFALKHIDFMTVLAERYPDLRPRNLLTVFIDRHSLAVTLSELLGASRQDAEEALSVLTLCGKNVSRHSFTQAHSIPLIRTGENTIVRSVAGVLANPWDFLVTELRARFPADWDRAVSRRESMFRKELYDLFPEQRFLKVSGPVRVRYGDGGVRTDIDATIYDRSTGHLGLFQLKWQDGFGSSMRMRESRKSNLMDKGNAWVEAVHSWLLNADSRTLTQHFRLSAKSNLSVDDSRLFVIGRNFAHFSGSSGADDKAAWGMWPQLVRLIVEAPSRDDPIGHLFDELRRDKPHARAESLMASIEEEELEISGNQIRFRGM